MIDPQSVALYVPQARKGQKRRLFDQVGARMGRIVRRVEAMAQTDLIPASECFPEMRPLFAAWAAAGRPFLYIDRGYLRRGRMAAAGLGQDPGHGYWRWHRSAWQMETLRPRPPDRLQKLMLPVRPWRAAGSHIVVAAPTDTYARFHGIEGWLDATLEILKDLTDRAVVVRRKYDPVPLDQALRGAHALVTHGSIAAVEAAVMGVPVFVDPVSAARHVGLTDLSLIETPVYPDRAPWLAALAYCQFDEREMIDGTMWRILE